MSRKPNYKKEILHILQQLYVQYPTFSTGRHLSMALADYGDIWGMTDKEMVFALQKYQSELELDSNNIVSEDYVDEIVKDGLNLSAETSDEEEEDDYE